MVIFQYYILYPFYTIIIYANRSFICLERCDMNIEFMNIIIKIDKNIKNKTIES